MAKTLRLAVAREPIKPGQEGENHGSRWVRAATRRSAGDLLKVYVVTDISRRRGMG